MNSNNNNISNSINMETTKKNIQYKHSQNNLNLKLVSKTSKTKIKRKKMHASTPTHSPRSWDLKYKLKCRGGNETRTRKKSQALQIDEELNGLTLFRDQMSNEKSKLSSHHTETYKRKMQNKSFFGMTFYSRRWVESPQHRILVTVRTPPLFKIHKNRVGGGRRECIFNYVAHNIVLSATHSRGRSTATRKHVRTKKSSITDLQHLESFPSEPYRKSSWFYVLSLSGHIIQFKKIV